MGLNIRLAGRKSDGTVSQRIRVLEERVERLSQDRAVRKSFLATLVSLQPLIAGVLIAGVGTMATINYNNHQLQIAELNALDKFRPYLASDKPQDREFGYYAIIALGHEALVAKLIGTKKDPAGENPLVALLQSNDASIREIARLGLLSLPQERRVRSIVNIFERGTPEPNYQSVTAIPGDTGILGYGVIDATLGSGNLYRLIKAYSEVPGAKYREKLALYLDRLASSDGALAKDDAFARLLKDAGTDPEMQRLQDVYFKERYLNPAYAFAQKEGISTALGIAVIYDSIIQGSWAKMRDDVKSTMGTVEKIGEKKWIEAYVKRRKEWMSSHPRIDLQRQTYRMDTFLSLIAEGNWELIPPLKIRGVVIPETLEDSISLPSK